MGLSAEQLKSALDSVAARDAAVAACLAQIGYPEPRIRPRGYGALLRTILGQQVSFKAAAAMWDKFTALAGDPHDPATLLRLGPEDLRSAGFSRQKAAYALGLAEAVASGRLDFDKLPEEDEEAIATLTALKGIGRWSAEIYLLFSEGRPDIFPAGDLAVQLETGRLLGLEERPSEKQARAIAERWRPHRGAMASFLWHRYSSPPV